MKGMAEAKNLDAWDGWCDDCDYRSEYITGARVKAETRDHVAATGHRGRVRHIEHWSYEPEGAP